MQVSSLRYGAEWLLFYEFNENPRCDEQVSHGFKISQILRRRPGLSLNRSQLQARAMVGAEPRGGFQKMHSVLAGASRIRLGCTSREGVLACTPLLTIRYLPILNLL